MANAIFSSSMLSSFVGSVGRANCGRIITLTLLLLSGAVAATQMLAAEPKSTAAETPAKGVPGEGLAGFWQGSLRVGPVELRVLLKLKQGDDGSITGTMDSIDQGATEIPISSVAQTGVQVRVALDKIGGVFEGRLNETQSEIEGQWKQGGQSFPIVFKRLAKEPVLTRPQEPKPPFPYVVEEVTFENTVDGVTLAGTFTQPKTGGPHPAVVLISGSGPQDRDEALMGHRPFAVLADHLTREKIAVLRFDDRGFGKSTGEFRDATHDDFVADVLVAVDWLKAHPNVDGKRIGLVGHSEGGIVAPLAAIKQPDDIAFIVLMAGVGVPTGQLLERQGRDISRAMGMTEELIAQIAKQQKELYRLIGSDLYDTNKDELKRIVRDKVQKQFAELTEEQRQTLGLTDAVIEAQVETIVTPWFLEFVRYDPQPVLTKVRCPVLAINGEKDLQVAADENLPGIRKALEAGGNRDVQVVELPGLNHLFQTCTTGSPTEYGRIEETFAPTALKTISDWIRQHTELR